MNQLNEKNFEKYIEEYLVSTHKFVQRGLTSDGLRKSDTHYDRALALDVELLAKFVQVSQPNAWEKLVDRYSNAAAESLAKRVDQELTSIGALEVLRNGVKDQGIHVDLAYFKPNTSFNTESERLYKSNLFSIMRQVHFTNKDESSIDTVLFLNGIPIITIELKNQLTGQNVEHAKYQYRNDRNPREKLFTFKRCLVHFAVDNNLAFMTTKLDGLKTYFLPFNKGYNNSAGNPPVEDKFATHYLWEDVLSPDSILELINNFMHLQIEKKKDPTTGRVSKKETLLFPRYHQRDVVRKLVMDARMSKAGKNYLIQHSAGSGKSNSIAWAAHNLSNLHTEGDKKVFDKVIIITDRRVLDRQLRDTVVQFEKQRDVVRGVTTSAELREALQDKTKIIVSTLQKFPVIVEGMENLMGKTFAVIVDEAHSSQSGESTKALKQTLSKLEEAEQEDEANSQNEDPEIWFALQAQKARGQLPHVSFFAFTATPKEKTLELFGSRGTDGKYYPFSLYPMKQAIEEGFILDVLKNYTTHKTYFEIFKKVVDKDPEFEKKKAYLVAINYADLHEHGIEKKSELIIEHYYSQIMKLVNKSAKAMIVTKSRLHAVRYYQAISKYLADRGYPFKALVAFSGEVTDGLTNISYTESNLNGFPESETADRFDEDDQYRILIVANKYQTGFDQPKLTAMYVDKKLGGVAAVQTLSRLNRTAPGKDEVFVLDFVNQAGTIQDAFEPYYTSTILSESTDPNILYDLQRDILNYAVFGREQVDNHYSLLVQGAAQNQAIVAGLLDSIVEKFSQLDNDEKEEFRSKVDDFVRRYSFVAQLFTFGDAELEKFYELCRNLRKKLPAPKSKLPYEILEQIDLSSIAIAKGVKHAIGLTVGAGELDPMSSNGRYGKSEDEKERLSLIVKGINEAYGIPKDMEADQLELIWRIKDNETLGNVLKHNTESAAREKFNEVFEEELMKMFAQRTKFYQKMEEDKALKEALANKIFQEMYKSAK